MNTSTKWITFSFLLLSGMFAYIFYVNKDEDIKEVTSISEVGSNESLPKVGMAEKKRSNISKPNNTDELTASSHPFEIANNKPSKLSFGDLYRKYEKNQEASNSQLNISLILGVCGNYSARSYEDVDRIVLMIENDHDAIAELRANYEKCAEVYEILGDVDLEERSKAWLESAASAGNPVARLVSLYSYPESPRPKDVLPILYDSFIYIESNPEFKKPVYETALRYFIDNIEPMLVDVSEISLSNYRRGPLSDAWQYLNCKHSWECDLSDFIDLYERYYFPAEIEEMRAKAAEIELAIREKNWEGLGLEVGTYNGNRENTQSKYRK